ncbi:MAG TPA: hypothetical protein VKB12_19040 [Pyrinomonadaceae bacterium]|nr:hypothetical protein [Pyrinomonadaceae bacterium]
MSGGSVTVEFDKKGLTEQADGKHHHPKKKIQRVEITGGDMNLTDDKKGKVTVGTESGKVIVKIFYGD